MSTKFKEILHWIRCIMDELKRINLKMKTIKAKVHMLPTEDISQVHYNKVRYPNEIKYELSFHKEPSKCKNDGLCSGNQHLYITTDEEIKEGDWVYWTDPEGLTSDINQVVSVDEEMIFISHPEHSETEALPHECRKIIATTDTELHYNKVVEEDMHMYKESLPHIPQHIIEAYIKKPFDEVLVEYEVKLKSYHIEPYEEVMLKTDSNNCTIIHPVEDKMYSRDTLDKILKECYRGGVDGVSWEEIAKRIKENL